MTGQPVKSKKERAAKLKWEEKGKRNRYFYFIFCSELI